LKDGQRNKVIIRNRKLKTVHGSNELARLKKLSEARYEALLQEGKPLSILSFDGWGKYK